MRDLDLTSLRLFATVCETRNMARAGEQAHLAGSAISKRLAQLEHTVGTQLLIRRRHGVDLTPAGETLAEHARTLLACVERISRDMAAYASGVRGQVRLLATSSVMAESLANDVAAFLQQPEHRDIRVDMEEGVSADVVRRVRDGGASLGICWDAADFGGLQTRAYRSDHLAVVVHTGHPLAAQTQLCFAQTLPYEQVSMPSASAVQLLLQREAARAQQTLVYRTIMSNFDAALRVVGSGIAIGVVPLEVAQPYAATLGLKVIPLTDVWAKRNFAICYRSEANLSAAARLLLSHLVGAGGASTQRNYI
jgi:DNA-binding transcriptional LysR family regulator